ncbi:bifunctional glycosyltransferase family 2 protein/CDP-glycerol:glycerophosphate glycerophosphotransferase [Bacillus thuringiensis]|uniref:bifunctional glycosyltransferase/CDP-glycerol:glycerophosphate glycerophosphotransferase n=1 Tax=Bacillus thuringiensis TaxID=1428 RepID=UPI0021E89DAF|nr:bifunctional glycosyltransferase family 2 protein/CDP-glycerol:glycerophosphate glycerophosphotransferase [Bacillus thuringiensis]
MDLVSVIISVHNKEDYIERCLQSVVEQTHQNLEIIVVNDASTDKSKLIIEKFTRKYDHIYMYQLKKQSGVAKARNLGVNKATGDYIYFLDADDFITPYTLELFLKHIGPYNTIAGKIFRNNIEIPESIEDAQVQFYTKGQKTKALRGRTSVNILIKRSFIKMHKLRFDQKVDFFSDITFSIPAIVKVKTLPMIDIPTYIKGDCYEPIENPTLTLLDDREKIGDFLYVYNKMKDSYGKYVSISRYLDRQLMNFYFKNISKCVASNTDVWMRWFNVLSESMNKLENSLVQKRNFFERKEIAAIQEGKANVAQKWMKRKDTYVSWKNAFKTRQGLYKEVYHSFLTKLPLKRDRVVFESFAGKSYSCNPRYIYEEMLKQCPDMKFIWIFNDTKKDIPGSAKKVKRLSWKYYYYMATSKYWVANARMPAFLEKRPETIYLQTWHGTPLKKLASDMKEVHMPGTTTEKYKRNFFNESRKWDYLVSPNDYSTEIFKRAFKFEKETLDVGYPRNDLLYHPKEEQTQIAKDIKKKIGIPTDKKVVLYAPTWRDDEFYEKGKYKFNLKLDLQEMQRRLGDQYVVALRMHYLIAENIDISGLEEFVYNLSNYEDIAELYVISDVLITDYSSVFFDYGNLGKPILFFTYDIDKYRDTLRGFYFNFAEEAPGPLLKTSNEVIDAIESIEEIEAEYKGKFDQFYNRFCHLDDGNAAKNIVQKVFNRSM